MSTGSPHGGGVQSPTRTLSPAAEEMLPRSSSGSTGDGRAPSSVRTATAAHMQARIRALMAELTALQAEVDAMAGEEGGDGVRGTSARNGEGTQ